jgi:hypothetical protein
VRTYSAEDAFELLLSRDQEFALENPFEIRKQSATDEEAEESEPESEERTVRVSNLTEGRRLTECGIWVFEDVDWSEQGAAAFRHRIIRALILCEDILKEKKRSLSGQTSALCSLM